MVIKANIVRALIVLSAVSAAACQRDISNDLSNAIAVSDQRSPRIIGGHVAAPGAWPMMVALFKRGRYSCGGLIISSRFVLTAAHCVFFSGVIDHELYVVAGTHDISPYGRRYSQRIKVRRSFVHVEWPRKDIALLELECPLEFSDKVKPVFLPEAGDELKVGHNITLIGWGLTAYNSTSGETKPTNLLQHVTTRVLNINGCQLQIPEQKDDCICAGEEGKDTCGGDSGGPLLVQKPDNQWYAYGITSGGPVDCTGEGLYTKISAYIDWIEHDHLSG